MRDEDELAESQLNVHVLTAQALTDYCHQKRTLPM
jgi:hypothetical protein